MTKIPERQIQRLTIVSQSEIDITQMNCGAFIDFFNDVNNKGQILQMLGQTVDPLITNIQASQNQVIQAPPSNGLKCNMVFGVCLDRNMLNDANFTETILKRCILEALIECFKNCVDSIVINCVALNNLCNSFNSKIKVQCVMEALKAFYLGQLIEESGNQYSKRFVGKITIVCDDNLKNSYEQKSNFTIQEEIKMDNVMRLSQLSTCFKTVNDNMNDFMNERTLTDEKGRLDFASVESNIMSFESLLDVVEALITEYDNLPN